MTTRSTNIDIRLRLIDQASQGMRRFGQTLRDNAQDLRRVGIAATAMGGAIAAAMGLAVKSFANVGDEIQKMSLRTGISVEALSELRFAAQIAGAEISGLEIGIRRMSSAIIDADAGLAESIRAFDQLGIKISDVINLTPEDAFFTLVEALGEVENANLQSALAQDIFGRSGTALLPLLEQGAAGFRALRQEAHDLGATFDQETANAAAELVDAMTRLKFSAGAIVFTIGAQLAPALIDLANRLTTVVSIVGEWTREHPTLTKVLLISATAISGMALSLGLVTLAIPTVIQSIALLGTALTFLAAHPILIVGTAFTALVTLWVLGSDEMREKMEEVADTALGFSGVVGEAILQVAKAVDRFTPAREIVTDLADSIRGPLVDAFGDLERIAEDAQAAIDGVTRSQIEAIAVIGGFFDAVEKLGIPLGRARRDIVDLSTAQGRADFVMANLRREFGGTADEMSGSGGIIGVVADAALAFTKFGIPLVETNNLLFDMNTFAGRAGAALSKVRDDVERFAGRELTPEVLLKIRGDIGGFDALTIFNALLEQSEGLAEAFRLGAISEAQAISILTFDLALFNEQKRTEIALRDEAAGAIQAETRALRELFVVRGGSRAVGLAVAQLQAIPLSPEQQQAALAREFERTVNIRVDVDGNAIASSMASTVNPDL